MATVIFNSDNSVQGTITSITSTPLGINTYAYNTNLSSLSTYTKLNIDNLNTTSTSILGNLNSLSNNSTISVNNLNLTSTTILGYINSLSTNTTLNISNLQSTSTTILNNLNSYSFYALESINNLNSSTATINNNLNSLSTNTTLNISNLQANSTTMYDNLNYSLESINNLNAKTTTMDSNLISLSTNSIFYINNLSTNSSLSINNLQTTSTTINNNLNSLSGSSFFLTNYTNLNTLNVSGISKLNNSVSCISSLNVSGNTTLNNATTINSSLNVVGNITGANIIGSGSSLTHLNYNAILNPPTIISFNNPSTFISTLNVSGNTTLNNATTIRTTLNVAGDINTSGLSVFGINTTLSTKQNNLTFSNPFLNTSNTISLKYDNTKLNVDASGNLTFIGVASQWTTTGTSIFYNGNIDCGGGIAINGSNAFFSTASVDAGNLTNTYINFKNAGSNSDWCYLRQIGGDNSYKLALDFHDDDADARFCIRKIQSTAATDIISEVFTVDNGNVSCTGKINLNGELINQYWKFTNQSDYCRLYNTAGTAYYNFAANILFASASLSVGTTANITGNLNCGTLQIGNSDIYYYLFNNTGGIHGDTNGDFNNISNFGYKFVNGLTNSPNTHGGELAQYYSWAIGLGSNYNFSQYVCQFAIPRANTTPTLSVRFKENGGWGTWRGIRAGTAASADYAPNAGNSDYSTNSNYATTAGTANSLATGAQTINGTLFINGWLFGTFLSYNKTPSDYLGLNFDTTYLSTPQSQVFVLYNTFTGFHRSFLDNEPLYNVENAQTFKNEYMGRIVIATGKIATDISNDNAEWEIKYDKEGITIEDAVPMIRLSRTRKDKRVFGVIGEPSRKNSRPDRQIVNSVGEGGIMVINSNGNIENGDYITSSDFLGYGEKQDDDLLHNYTVAKATIDCNFELESPYYNCFELEGTNYKIAFIACTYHCG